MMTTKETVAEFIRRCDRAGKGGDADPYSLLDGQVNFMVNGTTPLSGTFPGLNILKIVLLDTVKKRVRRGSVSAEEFVGTGDRVAALLRITAETVDGRIYNENGETCGCLFRVKDGKITEIFLFPDTTLIETIIYNRTYVLNQQLEAKAGSGPSLAPQPQGTRKIESTSKKTPRQVVDQLITLYIRSFGGEAVDPFEMLDENVYYIRHGYVGSEAKCNGLAEVRQKLFPQEVMPNVRFRPGYGTYPVEYIEEGNRVVVIMKGRGDNARGIPYNNTYFFLFEVRDNKIVRVVEDLDASLSKRCFWDMHLEEGDAPL